MSSAISPAQPTRHHNIRTRSTVPVRAVGHETWHPRLMAVCIIFAFMFMTGIISGMLNYSSTSVINQNLRNKYSPGHNSSSLLVFGSHSIAVLGLLLYPACGFLADVFFGRYWIIVVSTSLMSLGTLFFSIAFPFYQEYWNEDGKKPIIMSIFALGYFFSTLGVAGFRANVVQFGLDQLMDYNSRYLSLYLHWLVWIGAVGAMVGIFPLTLTDCENISEDILNKYHFDGLFQFMPLPILVFLVIILVIAIQKRSYFYTELGNINPYKMVLKVIGYAVKHRHPQQRRSAFFYHSGLNPGRLDLSKIHYGGPFSTEDVENVKTFLRILLVLMCVGPVFILKISTTYFMYQRFVFHMVKISVVKEKCLSFWPLLGSGNQVSMISVVIFPIYIAVIFKMMKGVPKILTRLMVVIIMWTVSLISILTIEVIGHYKVFTENGTIETTCALSVPFNVSSFGNNSLNIHWANLLVPNILIGLALPMLYTTVFEFISAQSPRSMTGLIMGTFFFIEGIFQLIGAVNLVPFSLSRLWDRKGMNTTTDWEGSSSGSGTESSFIFEENVDHSNNNFPFSAICEVWYLVVTIVIGFIGIALFSVVAWRYKYRKREEEPFSQSDIEEIITRGIDQDLDPRDMLDVASVEAGESRQLLYDDM